MKTFFTLLFFAGIVLHANAQVVYTDVKPDRTFNTSGSVYHLDLNNDGINDFDISYTTQTKNNSHCVSLINRYIQIIPLNHNEVSGDDSNNVPVVKSNVIINGAAFTWKDSAKQVLAEQDLQCERRCIPWGTHCHEVWLPIPFDTGYWAGAVNKYIPLRLHAGSNIYYGWVRLDVAANRDSFTIKDYAYNSNINHAILSGQTIDFRWVAVSHIRPASICPGANISVTYVKSGAFNSSNIFKAQLSDSKGSFLNPVTIGTIYSTTDGTIEAIIPANTSSGAEYRIRVVSSNPYTDSVYDNRTHLVIGAAIIANGPTEFCSGSRVTLTASSGNTYKWLKGGNPIQGATKNSIKASSTGSYKCIITNVCGTNTSNTIVVTVHEHPDATITAAGPTTFCSGESVMLNANTGSGLIYQWETGSTKISGATGPSYIATISNGYYCVKVTNEAGCSKTSPQISVIAEYPVGIVSMDAYPDTVFCTGDSVRLEARSNNFYGTDRYTWRLNGEDIPGVRYEEYFANTAGVYTCKVANTCGSKVTPAITLTEKQCLINKSVSVIADEKIISKGTQLKVAPNPFSNSTTISFTLPQSQKASISIYDMNGRLLKTIADEEMQAGNHQLTWNAKDEKGSAVVAGIYLLKMQAGNYVETRKLVVVK